MRPCLFFPPFGRIHGWSIDALTALRWEVFGTRRDPASTPVVVIAIDEEIRDSSFQGIADPDVDYGIGYLVMVGAWTCIATLAVARSFALPLSEPFLAGLASMVAIVAYRRVVTDRMDRLLRRSFGLYLAPPMKELLCRAKVFLLVEFSCTPRIMTKRSRTASPAQKPFVGLSN